MKIYHYTSIETLALILQNKALRFNDAKFVDDPNDAITKDYGSMQDYVFISCGRMNQPKVSLYGKFTGTIVMELD